jgi:SseB protein N-terminal domain/SseB protein C-terminal domain
MPFAPENPLEEILVRAASDPALRPQFYGLLMQSPLVVMGRVEAHDACDVTLARLDGRGFELAQITGHGRNFHPVFSSLRRLHTFDPAPPPYFTVAGRALFDKTRGAAFVLNCRSEIGKELLPDELAPLLNAGPRRIPPVARDVIGIRQPDPYPGRLTGALGIYFLNRLQVVAAHMLETMKQGDDQPHLLIGLVARGDCRRIIAEMGEVADSIKVSNIIDVILLDPERPRTDLQARLLAIPPFYARPVTPLSQGMH